MEERFSEKISATLQSSVIKRLRGNLIFGKKDCLEISKEFCGVYGIDYSAIFPSSNAIFAEEGIKIMRNSGRIFCKIHVYIYTF